MTSIHTSSIFIVRRCAVMAIFLLMEFTLSAQYQPMVVDSANWVTFTGVEVNDSRLYSIVGDTIIDDVTYGVLYEHTCYTDAVYPRDVVTPYVVGTARLFGYLRDDVESRSVFGRIYMTKGDTFILSQDTLIHSFNGSIGDTIQGLYYGSPIIINNIDSLLLFDRVRKVFSGEFADTLIEGVGSARYGPIGIQNLQLTEGAQTLVQYCVGSFSKCNIDKLVSVRGKLETNLMSAYPIPVYDYLNVICGDAYSNQIVKVYIQSSSSKVAWNLNVSKLLKTELGFQVPATQLLPGAYILVVVFKKNKIGVVKFIKG